MARVETNAREVPDTAGRAVVHRPTLDIVIVNWNTGSCLRECVRSVAEARRSEFELGDVVLVDNASTDDSLAGVQDLLPVRLVRNTHNRGFAAASNQGAAAGQGDLVLFLNPDTRLMPETLDLSVAFMADPRNATIGICGGQMLGDDGMREPSCWRFPTLGMFVAMMSGLSHAFPRWFPRQRLAPEDTTRSGVVDQVIGAYFLVRRSVFETLEGFDERFFVYLEDVDLAYRASRLGHPSYFLAHVPVHHRGRVSSDQVRGRRLFYLLRSRTEYARKHWPPWQAALLAALILAVEFPARALSAAARGRRDEATAAAAAARLYAGYVMGLVRELGSVAWIGNRKQQRRP